MSYELIINSTPDGVITALLDDNKLIEDMQSHGYYVDCVFNGQNVFFTKNGGN